MKPFKALIHCERGAVMTEYALLLAVVSVGVIGVLRALNIEIENVFETVRRTLEDEVAARR